MAFFQVGKRVFQLLTERSLEPIPSGIKPSLLAQLYGSMRLDNFEALAARALAGGTTAITILSDDNYNPLQETLLVEFLYEKSAN